VSAGLEKETECVVGERVFADSFSNPVKTISPDSRTTKHGYRKECLCSVCKKSRRITPVIVQRIIQLSNNGYSRTRVSNLLGISRDAVTNCLRNHRVPIYDAGRNHPTLDDDLFINEDFWWLIGYTQGDGHVNNNGIDFKATDHELISEVQKLIKSLFGLTYGIHTARPQKETHSPVFSVRVGSRILIKWLKGFGFEFGISKWNVPILPTNLFSSYVAGLFDAEGDTHLRKTKQKGLRVHYVAIYSKNRYSLELILKRLADLGIRGKVTERKKRDFLNYDLIIYGSTNLKRFAENIGNRSRLPRKKRLLDSKYLPSHR